MLGITLKNVRYQAVDYAGACKVQKNIYTLSYRHYDNNILTILTKWTITLHTYAHDCKETKSYRIYQHE
jgi:hypothetical protein